MGLKIRRLKGGFAYYAEYKFCGRCVYETIKAPSVREAKRIYSARYKELRDEVGQAETAPRVSRREAHESQVNAIVASLLRVMVSRSVLSADEARELIDSAFTQLDALQSPPLSPAAARARESIRQALFAKLEPAPALVLHAAPAALVPQMAAPFGDVAHAASTTAPPDPTDLVSH